MKQILALLTFLLAAACATLPAESGGSGLVSLGETARIGPLRVTPEEIVEDSRCPENARCIWAGLAVVRTQVTGEGGNDGISLQLGEPYAIGGGSLTLTSVLPEKRADRETAPGDYRVGFEWRPRD